MRTHVVAVVAALTLAACHGLPRSERADPPRPTAPVARRPPAAAVSDAPAEDWRGRHRIEVGRVGQQADGAGGSLLDVQIAMAPRDPDAFLDVVNPVRRFVTTDGFELTYPDQRVTPLGAHALVGSGVSLGPRTHRGLRDLEIDVRIVHVDVWAEATAGPPMPASHGPLAIGPFEIAVHEDPVRPSVTISGEGEVGRRDAPLVWDFRRAIPFLIARDATGRAFVSGGASGTGFAAVVRLEALDDAGSRLPVVYPLTVSLRIPAEYRFEPRTVMFHDLPLPTVAPTER